MKLVVGEGSCGVAAGAEKVYAALETQNGGAFTLGITGCIGMCFLEPIVDIRSDTGILLKRLVRVSPADAPDIASAVKANDLTPLDRLEISEEDASFLTKQTRIALRNCGVIDPENIDDSLAAGGYEAIKTVLQSRTPEQVIEEIKVSGLAGRGGAGFPTWFKWDAARKAPGKEKYLICNADEGDPGAFMDRAVIESDPHTLIEGMLIAAYAIGASRAFVYVRAEYPLAVRRLQKAIADAKEKGFLGEHILGTDFSLTLRIKAGAGAFVCGEETALIESLEGKRGMPRLKPPFPAQKGYLQKPSNINNVETFANVAWIINHGGEAFANLGTENLVGRDLTEGEYTFNVWEGSNLVASGSNTAAGPIVFDTISYTLDDVGTHIYTVTEDDTGDSKVIHDDSEISVTVVVTDNGSGTLEVQITEGKNSITFTNTQVNVVKKDSDGNTLSGAALQVLDSEGSVADSMANHS